MKFNFLFSLIILFLVSCEEMPKEAKKESKTVITIDKQEGETVIEKRIPEKVKTVAPQVFKKAIKFGELNINIEEKEDKLFVSSDCEFVEDFSVDLNGVINSFIVTDVDADGFNEFYCVTNKGDLVAYASFNNKSFGEIFVKQKPASFYENFNEVKFWEVKNKKLLITFSIGIDKKLNIVRYSLIKGESGVQLIAN